VSPATLAANGAAAGAALLFGASVVATRTVVQEVPPLTLAVARFGQGGLLLFAGLLACAPRLLRLGWPDLPRVVYVNLNPMVATVLGALLLGERLSGVFVAGFLSVLGGVVLVSRGPTR